MSSKQYLTYCLSKSGAVEDYPFGPEVIVVKVMSKMFALLYRRDGQDNITLKCDPYLAVLFRQRYTSVIPGYHLNKRYWNTILVEGDVPRDEIQGMIDHSYECVVNTLPLRKQKMLMPGLGSIGDKR